MPHYETWDGLRIAYEAWDTEAGGPPVVLLHGFIANGQLNWVLPGVVDALREAGRHVVAIDARGHGASDKPHDPERYGEPAMTADVRALVDHLGAPSYDVVGYSMGAVIAIMAAIEDPRVRRLAVGGIGASVVEQGGVDGRVLPSGSVAQALLADDPSTVTDPGARAFRQFADQSGGDRLALAAVAQCMQARVIALDRIHVPTLVLAGEDDLLASRPEVLSNAIANGRLERVPGDHMSAVATPRFREALVEFLAQE